MGRLRCDKKLRVSFGATGNLSLLEQIVNAAGNVIGLYAESVADIGNAAGSPLEHFEDALPGCVTVAVLQAAGEICDDLGVGA